MKRIALILVSLMTVCCASAFASPLQDYSLGAFAVDLSLSQLKVTSNTDDWDSNYNGGFAVTGGLGGNWALQFRNSNWSASRSLGPTTLDLKACVNDLNLLYKLNKTFRLFVGGNKLNVNFRDLYFDRTAAQIGLIATVKLAPKFTGWGLLSTGADIFSAEAGHGYALSKNLEVNIFYTYRNYTNLEFTNSHTIRTSARVQGVGAGLTATF